MQRQPISVYSFVLISILALAPSCLWGNPDPGKEEKPKSRKMPGSAVTTKKRLLATVRQAEALVAALQEAPSDDKKQARWLRVYRMVSELERCRRTSGLPGRKDMTVWRQAKSLERRFAKYLQENKRHVDRFAASVEDARVVLARVRRGGRVSKRRARTAAAYSHLSRLNAMIDSRTKPGGSLAEMLLEAHRLKLELMIYLGEDIKDADLHRHIDLAVSIKGEDAFQHCLDYGEFLSRTGNPAGVRIVGLLIEVAKKGEDKEKAGYWRLKLLHRQDDRSAPEMLRLAQEFLKDHPTGKYVPHVTYIEADSYFWMGKMPEAVASFDKARRLAPEMHNRATARICEAYRLDGKHKEALAELKKIKPTPANEDTIQDIRKRIEMSMKQSSR